MPKPTQNVIRVVGNSPQAKLSPAQKKFNSLMKKIEQLKESLAVWRETIPHLHKLAMEKLQPLLETYTGHQVELVHLLDEQYADKRFTRNQREKIAHLILTTCDELINVNGKEELRSLYDKYNAMDPDFDSEELKALSHDFMKTAVKDALGVDLDDEEIDLDDPAKMAELLRNKMDALREGIEARRSKRKKSAKQLKKEAEQQEEEAKIGKSIREVYRQLVTELHPDREQDPEERQRKTELMQRITVAYKKKDLMGLLELQLTVEQIDQAHINNIAEERLKHFNKVLQRQADQLHIELEEVQIPVKLQMGMPSFQRLSPQQAINDLELDIKRTRLDISNIQHDLVRFKDVKQLKAWLKDYRMDDGMDDWLFGGPF